MAESRKRVPASLKLVVGLLALLALLAVLQYRWLGQVSRAERERMRTTLHTAVARFAEDFDREIARAFVYFRLDPGTSGAHEESRLAERVHLWNEETPYPDLVEDVFLAIPDEGGRFQWSRLDTTAERFQPVDEASASRLWTRLRTSLGSRLRGREAMPYFMIEENPAMAIPVPPRPERLRANSPRPSERRGRLRPSLRQTGALVVLRLDLDFIQGEWLPALASRYFHRGGELDFELVVFRSDDPDAVVFQSDPERRFVTGDAATGLFGPLRLEELRHLWVETGLGLARLRRVPGVPAGPPPPERPSPTFDAGNQTGLWQLVVRHRAGSLEAAVSAARVRNLVISLGILAVLAVSMVLILLSTRRAQQLARQQMEFVAGVTHELQTPLAVIRSAGENLADGVVDRPGQIKEYGGLIEKEGRRLSNMVNQVLEFAGLQSRGRPMEKVPVAIEEVLDAAVADCEPAISESGIEIEKNVAPHPSQLMADPAALRHALRNLIDNAVKYAGDGKWIGLSVRETKETIVVTIADRGPGIAPVDLPHVFEPFYRGSHPRSAQRTRGNGLGLSLVRQIVESHGGRVSVRSSVAEGTVFTVQLPLGRRQSR